MEPRVNNMLKEYLDVYPDTDLNGAYVITFGSLNALVEPFREGVLILYVLGKGLSKEAIEYLGMDTVYCQPKTKVHERLYKRLGFKEEEGGYLVWRQK